MTLPTGVTRLNRDHVIIFAFLYLQVLDLMTTLVGFHLGLGELSPFIRMMMFFSPAGAVVASKMVAVLLAGYCVYKGKLKVIRMITAWYAVLVVWNIGLLLKVLQAA